MPTSAATIDFLLDQLSSVPTVRVRKMFGEYALYCDGKVVALICDDQLFVKYTEAGKQFAMDNYTEGRAYPGAKPSMNVTDMMEDSNFLCTLMYITAQSLPIVQKKNR